MKIDIDRINRETGINIDEVEKERYLEELKEQICNDLSDGKYLNLDLYITLFKIIKKGNYDIKVLKDIHNLEVGDTYYSSNGLGLILKNELTTETSSRNAYLMRLEFGNVFLNIEDGNNDQDYKRAYYKVVKRIKELNEGWKPDWSDDSSEKKYFFERFGENISYNSLIATKTNKNELYMKNGNICATIIEELSDELLIVING